ncbi:hypothetical protein [Streptomyces rimosus]|nr:hypothetical protein [Streptomyces rimosus]
MKAANTMLEGAFRTHSAAVMDDVHVHQSLLVAAVQADTPGH